ncbi:hypothetical protein BAUCODRAFT_474343 [Baudoinia panamericana UAMH 10762]|uniref:Exocyst complex component SEC5 n=1 Tax=Baudoinia panamericana (strain UAMH 10762) TaxID=717646 RepID=M2NB91_BAUPA|nr:uncharacterized protein BAUCODRAFT_474343 [Baudoinia panamericana UAMH 10762]EMC96419.1 hypothetical protein BAUCODRAFT_474343 [Baudoinia panamericana UAMH 10762]
MPVTADQERQLLNHYKLTTLYPDTFPAELDQDDDVDDDDDDDDDNNKQLNGGPVHHPTRSPLNARMSASRYRNIDRHASMRSTGSLGPESVVQKDEPDPLGMTSSVASELRRRGVPVEEDLKLRNRFMLSSTSFSPQLFLSHVHRDASMDDLLRGLDNLSHSIEQKSASLKVLVESNFDRFVKAKSTIDHVYTEMRTQGGDASSSPSTPTPGRRGGHARHTSRSQTHFRNASAPFSAAASPKLNDRKKNALTKESEYGVLGIKIPLQEVTIKAEEVWGPAIGGREKEETLKAVIGAVDAHKDIFKLGSVVYEAIKKNDYDTVTDGWKQANRYADQAREIAAVAQQNAVVLADQDAQQILITAKMYHDVSAQIETYKRDTWRRLKSSHGRKPAAVADETDKEEHMELIGVLILLGVDENPIWEWLNSRCLYLKDKLARSFERSRVEIEILRRRLAAHERKDVKASTQYLRSASVNSSLLAGKDAGKEMDAPPILAFWSKLHADLNTLLSSSTGILGELLEFWETTQSFIDGKAQKSFPNAVLVASVDNLALEPDDVANLRAGAIDLVNQIRENVRSFFVDPPVEDLSELYSPVPPTPITPASDNNNNNNSNSRTPASARANRSFSFSVDAGSVPPPTPKTGSATEKFAFWPPGSNSLSASSYLAKISLLVALAATDLASLPLLTRHPDSRRMIEGLRGMVGVVRDRALTATCTQWVADVENLARYLERWERSPDRKDLTLLPGMFMGFEERLVREVRRMAFISEASGVRGANEEVIVSPPDQKLVQMVREKVVGEHGEEGDEVAVPVGVGEGGGSKSTRLLLTLSNLSHLRSDLIPHLLTAFESAFAPLKLTDETKSIRDLLSQLDARLFQAYTKPHVDRLSILIYDGINAPTWSPPPGSRPSNASQYVYDALLLMVGVHSEVTTTTTPTTPLLAQILSYLLEQASHHLLDAFKRAHSHYTLSMLMQATLDVEFLAQTLNTFSSDKAGEVQSQVYLALDERTDDEARQKLQGELPEMRGVLKRLREGSRGGFGCFRRERRGREGRKEGAR